MNDINQMSLADWINMNATADKKESKVTRSKEQLERDREFLLAMVAKENMSKA